MSSTVKREGVHCEKQEGACQKNTMSCVLYSWVGSNAEVSIVARVEEAGGVSYTSPEKQVGVSLWETSPSLFLAPPGPRHWGRVGRRIRLERSCLPSPRYFGEGQGAPDQSTLTGWARHPPYRREAF